MGVRISSVSLDHVLNWREEETTTIPIKRVVRKTSPTTQSQYFTRTPRRIEITARCTTTIKTDLRNLKNEDVWQELYDYDDSFVDYVWIESLSPEWQGDQDKNYPWYIGISLICSST